MQNITFLGRARGAASLGFVITALLLGSLSPSRAIAANFVFDIEYLGDNMTNLAPGSDEPNGQLLTPGDTFQWTIAPIDNRFWLVESAGSFFPLMAFTVDPSGVRTGDFTLVLRNNGADVFTLSDTAVQVQEVHLGTNAVNLPAGLEFDEMFLDYVLVSAVDLGAPPTDVDTTIVSRLPIFGAPENNGFSPGIVFVPEPMAGLLGALACCGALATRRRV